MKNLRAFFNRRLDPPYMPKSCRPCCSLLVILLAWVLPLSSSRPVQRIAKDVPEDVWSHTNRLLSLPSQKTTVSCGGHLRHQLNGAITSSGFPTSFPPLGRPCSWTIERGDGEGITLYLFELYLSRPGGLRVVAYDSDPDHALSAPGMSLPSVDSRTDYGTFNRESPANDSMVRTRKPFLRITVIPEHDVARTFDDGLHGFNVTFVITPRSTRPPELHSTCQSYKDCSRLGRCLASPDLSATWCECSEGHYGHVCQYGPLCDPDANFPVTPCHNGGRCWYSRPDVVECNCPANFGGEFCSDDKRRIRETKSASQGQTTDKPCHFVLRAPRGQIHSPNFPGVFPVPAVCEWIIITDSKTDTAIHFTESYLNDPAEVRITSYDFYENGNGTNAKVWGVMNYDYAFDFQTYPEKPLVISQPYIVIRMNVNSLQSMVRVKRYLLDRTGFNYTYVTFPKGSQPSLNVNCSGAFGCKWAGICTVNRDFTSSRCECFPGQTGNNCQYGTLCNPLASPPVNPCLNGASCEYYFGTELVRCDKCPPGFGGHLCESTTTFKHGDGCKDLKCEQRCIRDPRTSKMQCACEPGFSLLADKRKCMNTKRMRIKIELTLRHEMHPDAFVLPSILNSLGGQKFENCRKLEWTGKILSFICQADGVAIENFQTWLKTNRDRILIKGKPIKRIDVTTVPILDMKNLTLYSHHPTKQGKEMALVCVAHGSTNVKFLWKKDDVVFDPKRAPGMWVTEQTLLNGSTSYQVDIENVGRPHQGVYTCEVEDYGDVVSQSLFVTILRPPTVNIVPPTPAVAKFGTLLLNCLASQGNTTYKWTRKNDDVKSLRVDHHLTQIQNRRGRIGGMQLIIDKVDHNTEYRCTATNAAGTSHKVVKVRMLQPEDPACPDEIYQDIAWTAARADSHNEQQCPVIMNGTVARKCNKLAQWEEPDYSGCATVEVMQYKTNLEMIQRGFGQPDLGTLTDFVVTLLKFFNKNQPLLIKDITTIHSVLEELKKMAVKADIDDEKLQDRTAEVSAILKKELEARALEGKLTSDTDTGFETPVDIVKKETVGVDGRHTFVVTGKLECILLDPQQNVSETEETDVSHSNFTCPVLPRFAESAETPASAWLNVVLFLSMQDWPSSNDIANAPELGVTVNQTLKEDSSTGGAVSNVVDLVLHKYDPSKVVYTVNMTFSNIISVNESQNHDRNEAMLTADEPYECVQKEKFADEWKLGSCTTVHEKPPKDEGLRRRKRSSISVRCLCSLSSSRTIFAVRTVSNSSTTSSPLGSPTPLHPALVPVIIVLFVLIAIVGVALLIFRRKKQLLTCLLAVKKRTCDLFAHSHSSHETSVEIPLSPSANNRLSGTNVPRSDPDESTTLVDHRGRVVAVDSTV